MAVADKIKLSHALLAIVKDRRVRNDLLASGRAELLVDAHHALRGADAIELTGLPPCPCACGSRPDRQPVEANTLGLTAVDMNKD